MHCALLRCALAFGLLAISATAQGTTTNLLFVVLDDLGPEYVGCYQQHTSPASTPTLDAIAQNGLRFTEAYADPVCTPTRACLLTGRHAFRADTVITCVPGSPGLRDEEVLLPEVLVPAGFACGLVGKWHLGDRHGAATPNVQGWPFFSGALYGSLQNHYAWTRTRNGTAIPMTTWSTTAEVDEALQWIGQQTQPWVLMLHLHAPHAPFQAPPANLHGQNLAGLSSATQPIPFYKAMIEAADTELARLRNGLGSARANTNLVIYSDNGAPSAVAVVPPERAKGSLYEGGVRVPLLVEGPSVVRPGRIVTQRVHACDLFATALELCGQNLGNLPAPIDGRSLMPVLQDQPFADAAVYTETIGTGFGSGQAVVAGDYKLIRFTDDVVMLPHEELYDLRNDPRETVDLARAPTPASAQAYQNLTARLWQLREQGIIVNYGNGCPTTAGSVRLKSYAPPALGSAHHMRVLSPGVGANVMTFPAIVVIGASGTNWLGAPLPYAVDPVLMPGCDLNASPDWAAYFGTTNSLFWVWVPADPFMLGLEAYFQAAVADPAANAAGFALSPGYRFTIGR